LVLSVAFLLIVGCLLFFGPGIISGDELFFTNEAVIGNESVGSDIWHFNYPLRSFYASELKQLRLPFWCPLNGPGVPLFAEAQVGALYPLNLLFFGLLPLPMAFNLSILLHIVIAGIFAAALAFRWQAGLAGSILAGIIFAFSGFFLTHVKHFNLIQVAAWVPLLLLLTDSLSHKRTRSASVGIAAVVALMILAGHPQMAYFSLLITSVYALFLVIRSAKNGSGTWSYRIRQPVAFLGCFLGLVLIGALLTAPQLLPTARLTSFSSRSAGLSFEQTSDYRFELSHLLSFVNPYRLGDPAEFEAPDNGNPGNNGGFFDFTTTGNFFWEITGYIGLPALLLALFSVFVALKSRSTIVVPAVVLLAPSLLLALGRAGGLAWLFYHVVPGFSFFRFYSRFLLYVDLALAILAGIGLGLVLQRARSRLLAGIVTAVVLLLCVGDVYRVLGGHNSTVSTEEWTPAPITARRILALEADGTEPYRIISGDDNGHVFANAYLQAGGWKRTEEYGTAWLMLHPNLNMLYGIPALGYYFSSLVPYWILGELPWSLFNVKYILTPYVEQGGPMEMQVSDVTPVESYRGSTFYQTNEAFGIRLFRNESVLPRAFLVPTARVQPDASPIIHSATFDPMSEVILHEEPRNGVLGSAGAPINEAVTFLEYSPQRVKVAFTAPRPCWLFLSDTWYPEWHAMLDGSQTPVYRANHAGRAVFVPPGTHEVVFHYNPSDFRLGLIIAGFGLIVLFLWLRTGVGLHRQRNTA
jgi:hypothetical protein